MKVGALFLAAVQCGLVRAHAPSMTPEYHFSAKTSGLTPAVGSSEPIPVAAAPGVAPSAERDIVPGQARAPGVPNEDEVDDWMSTVTLSPTPLYSKFSKIDDVYETDEEEEQDLYLPNIAVNSSCILSSSSSSAGTFCRLSDDENQRIATASEEDPFILVDLESLYFVDILSFAVNVDSVSSRSKLSVMCLNNSHQDLMRTDGSSLPYVWQKSVLQNSGNYSFHVHAPCQYVRLQRLSLGPLVIANLKIYGATIKNREIINCLSGQEGEVCSGHGSCMGSTCSCDFMFGGEKCEEYLFEKYVPPVLQGIMLVSTFVALTMRYKPTKTVNNPYAKLNLLASDKHEEASRGLSSESFELDTDISSPGKLTRAVSSPATSIQRIETENITGEGSLHLLFASPLVMAVPGKDNTADSYRPIQALDIRREHALLQQSLRRAAGSQHDHIPVTVSTATIDQFHTLMTLGNVRCLHFSGHCTRDFLAFEDASGQLHQIKMPMLRGLLRSTVTAKSFKTLRMVVLNACNSENAALEFVLAGVPHVIGYKKRIRDSTATTFTGALYLSLACGRTVRDAFESAKEAVYSSPAFDQNELDAFVLLPERGDHSEVLWSNEACVTHEKVPRWPLEENMRPLPPLADEFIGRHVDLWQILGALTQKNRRVIVVNGEEGVGKTQLATAIAQHMHLRRSPQVCRDGIFVVKNSSDPRSHGLVQLAYLVDAVFKSMYQLLTNSHYRDEDWNVLAACERGIHDVMNAEQLSSFLELTNEEPDLKVLRRKIATKIGILADALAGRKANCLLVLDAVEESPELVSMFLAKLLEEVPEIQIVITCTLAYQTPLDVNLQHYNLGPLASGDAALLLVRHLKRKVLVDSKEVSLQELSHHQIVTESDGSPLAIIRAARELACKFNSNETVALPAFEREEEVKEN